jgi:hypothetical protein
MGTALSRRFDSESIGDGEVFTLRSRALKDWFFYFVDCNANNVNAVIPDVVRLWTDIGNTNGCFEI